MSAWAWRDCPNCGDRIYINTKCRCGGNLWEDKEKIELKVSLPQIPNTLKCCGNCFFRKTSVSEPTYMIVKLSCQQGYKLNLLLQPVNNNCWQPWNKKLDNFEELK